MKKKGSFMMTIGLLLLAAALVLTGYNIWESKQAEKFSNAALEEIMLHIEQNNAQEDTSQEMEVPDYVLFPDKEMPVVLVDGQYYVGAVQIPELDMTLPILAGEWSYAKLQKAPCCYTGSIYKDNMVVAGHNYWSHFSPIKSLGVGSEICFIDVEGNVFNYTVGWVDILQPTDVEKLTDNKDWDLTLFTCTYDGRERYTVRCIREN
ncbi:MAG: sortase [Schaedlerella sp.]|nr:sortase [Schaedlerella sp.]